MQEQEMIISCVPDPDDHKNLDFVRERMGLDPLKMPWLNPYPGSIRAECPMHGGAMWIGPTQQERIGKMKAQGQEPVIACHLCSLLYMHQTRQGMELMPLSKTETSYIDPDWDKP